MSKPNQYGQYYWVIRFKNKLPWARDEEIYLYADLVEIQDGMILFIKKDEKSCFINFAVPLTQVIYFAAASCIDGSEIALESHNYVNDITEDEDKKKRKGSIERNKITNGLRYEIMRQDEFACHLCGRSGSDAKLVVDHIVPISKGGKTIKDNLQTLCFECNSGKSNK